MVSMETQRSNYSFESKLWALAGILVILESLKSVLVTSFQSPVGIGLTDVILKVHRETGYASRLLQEKI